MGKFEYVDFRDLNNACPKDDFSLPIAELMIDTTMGHEALSFMDGSSRYNQIRMAPADEELTIFRTPKGIYCHKVMPFGLKNVGATYQRAIQKIFNDMLHKNVECYVDDLVVKSKKRENHFHDLRKVFECLRRYQLKMNPSKCAFGVTSGIGFIIRQRVSKAKPLKYVMAKSVFSDRLARWYLQLQQFEITYVPKKAVKGQVLADFLADHPMPTEWELSDDFPDEDVLVIEITPPWKMYSDGASHKEGVGAGIVFITSEGEVLPYSFTLTQNCSNNVAEYQALILGLEIVVDVKKLPLKVYGDSQLVVNQLPDVELEHLQRKDNKQADALAKLASTFSMTDKEARIPICKSWVIPPIFSDDEDDTFEEEENHVTEPTMVKDCIDYARRCQACQFQANLIHQPPEPLHPTAASWSFDAWGLDVVGPLTKSSGVHLYILAATDYFSRWAEAVPLKEVKKENVTDFIRTHIIYRYGTKYIITDNGKPFCNSLIDQFCQQFGFT
ncbi:UNVERIFIED_CONTAM: Polyprotein P3 [Sesamum calycinum]|uniref:Polyprotein P3 n=1 Tax=Sesamum calycinum TaxID=2727403 RepID=A0AAW2Q2Z1_9LAMI